MCIICKIATVTTCLIYTSWTNGRPITKVVSIGLVHLFPMLQNEKKSGNDVEVMMRLSVEAELQGLHA